MRPRDGRAIRLMLWGMAGIHVAHSLLLRHRRSLVEPLPGSTPKPEPLVSENGSAERNEAPAVLCLEGHDVDEATRTAAMEVMRVSGALAVDLVPDELPAEAMLRVLNRIDPEGLADNPLYAPGGAGYAVVVHPSVAVRMGVAGTVELAERADVVRETRRVQRYAPTLTVLRLAPGLQAPSEDATSRWNDIDEQSAGFKPYVHPAPVLPVGRLLQLAALVGGVITSPVAGSAALAAWAAKPFVVLGRSAVPCLTRPLRVGADALAELGVALAQRRQAFVARRATSPAPAPPLDELFDPARTSCPWCGSSGLVPRLDTTDLMQHKPGRFHLDECRACGHVFQNPALSIQGLNYYYEQFYDGMSAEALEGTFANLRASNEARIETMARFHEPRAWLDVGAGIGQFCVLARQRWPEARFDGLDLSDTVEEAQRRGWVDTAYRGLFPELADGLPRSYDVVSMHHYLEHTRDPRAELSAASKVLEPGGYLLVEVPDTASPWARRLGRFWNSWFQPQHQHFVTCDNLVAALPELGFEVLSVDRGSASTGADLVIAPMLAASSVAPNPNLPWVPEPPAVDQVKRLAAGSVGVVTSTLLMPVEAVKEAYLHGPGADKPSNAFRVVAQRR